MSVRRRAPSFVFLALCLGCLAQDVERPPVDNGECSGDGCSSSPVAPRASGVASAADKDAGGSAATARRGVVRALDGRTFAPLSLPLDLPTRVEVYSTNAEWTALSVDAGTFTFPEVAGSTWLSVRPQEPTASWLGTLWRLPNDVSNVAEVGLVESFSFEELLLTSLVVGGAGALQSGKAHAALTFVDAAERPLPGVWVDLGEALVAYDAGDAYSNALTETSDRGAALLLNLDLPSLRSSVELAVFGPGFEQQPLAVYLWAERDSVSFMEIKVVPPSP